MSELLHQRRRRPLQDHHHPRTIFNRLRSADSKSLWPLLSRPLAYILSGERNGRHYDEDIIIDSGRKDERRDDRALRRRSPSPRPTRRAPSPAPSIPRGRAYPSRDERDIAEEAAYYNERARERSYIGEGYHGATKDWAIVDVPPGTRRVEMEGVGGAKEEVTWQRYNGVRRSKFIAEDEPRGGELVRRERDIEIDIDIDIDTRDRGRRFVKEKSKTEGMWTEITKDLVSEEAIKEMGYEYEETEFFYYVMKYLRYVSSHLPLSKTISVPFRKKLIECRKMSRGLSIFPQTSKQAVANVSEKCNGSEKLLAND